MKGRRKHTSKKKELILHLQKQAQNATARTSHNQQIFMRAATKKGRELEPAGPMAGVARHYNENELILIKEAREKTYLSYWTKIVRAVDKRYDIRGSTLAHLVEMCLLQDGEFTDYQYTHFCHQVPEGALKYISTTTIRIIAMSRH